MKKRPDLINYLLCYQSKGLLLLALFILPFSKQNIHAQVSDTIGFGTQQSEKYGPTKISSSKTVSSNYSAKFINLFTQTELAEIGIFPGAVINSLAWHKYGAGVLTNGSGVNIKVSLRSNVDSIYYGLLNTGDVLSVFVDTYVGTTFTFAGSRAFSDTGVNFPTASSWVEISFSAPYTYTGGGLEILMDAAFIPPAPGLAPANSLGITWRYTNHPKPRSFYPNSASAYDNMARIMGVNNRPNVIFNYNPGPSCTGKPIAGTINMITTKACPGMISGHLILKGATSATGIKVKWEKKGANQSSFEEIPGAVGYELLDQLVTEATEYRAVVTCGSNTSTATFSMVPVALEVPDYIQDFETTGSWGSSSMPDCWQGGRGPMPFKITPGANTGTWASDGWKNTSTTGAARLYAAKGTYDWLISPQIDLGTGNWQLEFDLGIFTRNDSTAGTLDEDDYIAVVISTDGGTTWDGANTLMSWDSAQGPLSSEGTKHFTIPLNRYSGIIAIGFYVAGNVLNPILPALPPDVMIDNIKISTGCKPIKTPAAITGPEIVCRNVAGTYHVPEVSDITSYTWILPPGWTGSSITDSITVIPNDTEGRIQVVANITACASSDTQSLNVAVNPQPVIFAEDIPVLCQGDSIIFHTGAAATYQWMKDKEIITGQTDSSLTVNATGDYKVVTTRGNCRDTSLSKNVSFGAIPVPVLVENNSSLSTTIPFKTYQWNLNGMPISGATGPTYEVKDSGAYTVTVTDTTGCKGTSEEKIVNGKVSVDRIYGNKQLLNIYPNPVQGSLNITFNYRLSGNESIILMDMTGKTLQSTRVSGSTNTMDISSLSAGIYCIKISNDEYSLVYKITKD